MVSKDRLKEMYASQNGKCACCHDFTFPLVADYDTNGELRGLLCDTCTELIKLAHGSADLLRMWARYIEKYSEA